MPAEGASDPGVKLALEAEDPRDLGVQLKLHSLRQPYFMLELYAIRDPGVLIIVYALRRQGALTFNLRCTELSGVPSSLALCATRNPVPKRSACPFCTKVPGGPNYHLGPYMPMFPGVLVVNL